MKSTNLVFGLVLLALTLLVIGCTQSNYGSTNNPAGNNPSGNTAAIQPTVSDAELSAFDQALTDSQGDSQALGQSDPAPQDFPS